MNRKASFRDDLANIELVHFLDRHFWVDSFEEGGCGIFAGLSQNDPSATGMFDHVLWKIIDVVIDDQPAITDFCVFSDFAPGVSCRHCYLNYWLWVASQQKICRDWNFGG